MIIFTGCSVWSACWGACWPSPTAPALSIQTTTKSTTTTTAGSAYWKCNFPLTWSVRRSSSVGLPVCLSQFLIFSVDPYSLIFIQRVRTGVGRTWACLSCVGCSLLRVFINLLCFFCLKLPNLPVSDLPSGGYGVKWGVHSLTRPKEMPRNVCTNSQVERESRKYLKFSKKNTIFNIEFHIL